MRAELRPAWLATAPRHRPPARGGAATYWSSRSGAIALGRRGARAYARRSLRLEEKQAAAAVGQIRLAEAWTEALARHGITAAQVLLTLGRHRGAPPLPQRARDPGDAAGSRLRSGDQRERHGGDRGDPLRRQRPARGPRRRDDRAPTRWCCSPTSTASTPPIRAAIPPPTHSRGRGAHAADRGDGGRAAARHSSGGMATKLAAARIATGAGCRMAIALGHTPRPLGRLPRRARCTWFLPPPRPAAARKSWIAGSSGAAQGRSPSMTGPARALPSGRACCRRACAASTASSSAATRWRS